MGKKIVAIVGARLNSSRLPKKHLLPLAGRPMISHIFKRLSVIPEITQAVLATTADEYNRPLREWAEGDGVTCYSHEGDVDDLVGRVDAVVKACNADVILYVCGDCPLIEPVTISAMLKAIQGDLDVDLVKLEALPKGKKYIHEGFDIYSRRFWDGMVECAHEPFEREHIGAVYHHLNKTEPREISFVPEEKIYSAVDHRISVDTPSDYRFIRRLYKDWYSNNGTETIVDLKHIIRRLIDDISLISINGHVVQKQIKSASPRIIIYTEIGMSVGLGHLSRSMAMVEALQDYLGANVQLVIKGAPVLFEGLELVRHHWVTEFTSEMFKENDEVFPVSIFDLKDMSAPAEGYLRSSERRSRVVGIDFSAEYDDLYDLVWVPCFYVPKERQLALEARLVFGWGAYLLRGIAAKPSVPKQIKRLLILTGGSDAGDAGQWLPGMLIKSIHEDVHVTWLQGSYAPEPCIPIGFPIDVIRPPVDMVELLENHDAVLCQYGVSFFESLKSGMPVFAYDNIGAATEDESRALKEYLPGCFFSSAQEAVAALGAYAKENPEDRPYEFIHDMRNSGKNFAFKVQAMIN